MPAERIAVAALHAPVRVLGPGKRIGLWLQGCTRSCPGCLAPEMQPVDGGVLYAPEYLLDRLVAACSDEISGITVSGGEPLLQWTKLQPVLQQLLQARPQLTVILYTGYRIATLGNSLIRTENSMLPGTLDANPADIIIDGGYRQDLQDRTPALRGSVNQRFIEITGRVPAVLMEKPEHGGIQLFPESDGWFAAGVPQPGLHLREV